MKALVRCGRRWAVVVAVVGGLAVMAGVAQATTVYVSTAGDDANNGLTWTTAKRTVQAGLNAFPIQDQVWVAAGTYVGCIRLRAGVALYGGFAGNETDLSQRDWNANVTILDGNQAGSVVMYPSVSHELTRIDGFTIRNGTGTLVSSSRYGGGIYCVTHVAVANNTITGNSATYGGAVYSGMSMAITGNTIRGNSGSYGGGIYCTGGAQTIAGNVIVNNNSASNGAGIDCHSTSSPEISGNTIRDNRCSGYGWGGGIHCGTSTARILSNAIVANVASQGGGIACTVGTPLLANNTIAANHAYNYGDGYVDVVDLLGLIHAFGTAAGDPSYDATCDFNHDGAVDVVDLLDVVYNFGT